MPAVPSFPAIALAAACSLLAAGCNQPASTSVGTEIDDTVVTTRVKSALLADPDIKSFDLKVETRKGLVQLSGFVDSTDQMMRAISASRGVPGVTAVENNITLKGGGTTIGSTVDDSLITTKVKSALLADPNIRSSDIAVATRNGKVQLSGFVDNQSQIDQAVAVAGKMDGVTSVGNEMSVKK
jgi:hyperosmotically inducible periplasmic protein